MDKYVKIEDAAKAFSFHTPYCYDDCLNDLRSSILNGLINSVDVEPIVRSKWGTGYYDELGNYVWPCQNCKRESEELSPYCNNCGAKMDLE